MIVSISSIYFAEPSRREREPFHEKESLPLRYESKERSEHCDDASLLSSDSSRDIFLAPSVKRAMSGSSVGDKASANAASASRLCCKIFCAEYGVLPGFNGGLSARFSRGLLVLLYKCRLFKEPNLSAVPREGLVSREFASERGMPVPIFFGTVPV